MHILLNLVKLFKLLISSFQLIFKKWWGKPLISEEINYLKQNLLSINIIKIINIIIFSMDGWLKPLVYTL